MCRSGRPVVRAHTRSWPTLAGIAMDVAEFDGDGLVYEKNGVRVTAFEVDVMSSSRVTAISPNGAE
jgi:hypothetical protein